MTALLEFCSPVASFVLATERSRYAMVVDDRRKSERFTSARFRAKGNTFESQRLAGACALLVNYWLAKPIACVLRPATLRAKFAGILAEAVDLNL